MKFRTRDYLFLGFFGILLSILGPYIYYSGIIYMHIHQYSASEAGSEFTKRPELSDLWISVLSALVIYFSHIFMERILASFLCSKAVHVDGEGVELRNFKATKSIHYLHMFFWHVFCSIGHWYVIKDKIWQPWFMGGTGNFVDGFKNMPFAPMDIDGYYFGLILLGHPLQLIVTHFFINEREPDFAEMAMHHLAHFSLASSYIFTNMIPIGAMVAFVHD